MVLSLTFELSIVAINPPGVDDYDDDAAALAGGDPLDNNDNAAVADLEEEELRELEALKKERAEFLAPESKQLQDQQQSLPPSSMTKDDDDEKKAGEEDNQAAPLLPRQRLTKIAKVCWKKDCV